MAEPKEEHCLSNVAQCCEVTAVYQMPATLVDVPLVCNGIDRICNTSTKRKRVVLRFGTTRLRFVLVFRVPTLWTVANRFPEFDLLGRQIVFRFRPFGATTFVDTRLQLLQ